MNAYLNQYHNNQIATSSPEQILVMLYDGAIRFVEQAMSAMSQRNPEKRNLNINKTIAILSELSATLDHEVGQEIAANLDALYSFMSRELCRANIGFNPQPLKVVSDMLIDLRQTWLEAIKINHGQQQATVDKQAAEYKPFNARL